MVDAGLEHAVHREDDTLFCINRIVADAEHARTAVATANGLVLFDSGGAASPGDGAQGRLAFRSRHRRRVPRRRHGGGHAGGPVVRRSLRRAQSLCLSRPGEQSRVHAWPRAGADRGGDAGRPVRVGRRCGPRQLHHRQLAPEAQLDHGAGCRWATNGSREPTGPACCGWMRRGEWHSFRGSARGLRGESERDGR